MQISVALLVRRSSAPRPEGTVEGTHRRDRRDQTPQPPRWLSPHRTGDCTRLWHRYQQRHRPPGARDTLSTRGRNRAAGLDVLAIHIARGQRVAGGQRDELATPAIEECTAADQQRAGARLDDGREGDCPLRIAISVVSVAPQWRRICCSAPLSDRSYRTSDRALHQMRGTF